ncbi:MAG: hypothetical protein HYV33_00850 [Candidatus Kerfeldbacteria bacterium]|nr:hypothetical protein [Candidatus Kerfeldbacteria bacterium]
MNPFVRLVKLGWWIALLLGLIVCPSPSQNNSLYNMLDDIPEVEIYYPTVGEWWCSSQADDCPDLVVSGWLCTG